MLEDRDYMRQPEYRDPMFRGFRWSWTMGLIAVNLLVFVLMEISRAYHPEGFAKIFRYFALSNDGLGHGYAWQFLTFQFLHAGGWHFTGNMMALFFLGRMIEEMIGARRFVLLYITSGLIGGVFQTVMGLIFPHVFGAPVVGASAGVAGLLAALAALDPEAPMLLFFVLPVKIKHIAWAGALTALFYMVVPAQPGVAHAAHFGGMVMGFYFVRLNWRAFGSRLSGGVRRPEPEKSRGPRLIVTDEPVARNFLEAKVDPILDKISAQGIQSLTPREREVLENARKKMTRP